MIKEKKKKKIEKKKKKKKKEKLRRVGQKKLSNLNFFKHPQNVSGAKITTEGILMRKFFGNLILSTLSVKISLIKIFVGYKISPVKSDEIL